MTTPLHSITSHCTRHMHISKQVAVMLSMSIISGTALAQSTLVQFLADEEIENAPIQAPSSIADNINLTDGGMSGTEGGNILTKSPTTAWTDEDHFGYSPGNNAYQGVRSNTGYTLTINAASGYTFDIDQVLFRHRATSTGPGTVGISISSTNYTGTGDSVSTTVTTYESEELELTGLTSATIVLQGWDSGGSGSGEFQMNNLQILGAVNAPPPSPTITLSPETLEPFLTSESNPSASQSFTVEGSNLDPENAELTITAPAGFEVSESETTGYDNSINLTAAEGTLAETDIYVRLTGDTTGSFNDDIEVSGGGATTQSIAVEGTVIEPVPEITAFDDAYTETFSDFTSAETIPTGWTVASTGDETDYDGDWDVGTSAGLRGNANVLGYQHTTGSGTLTVTLTLQNNTGSTIEHLLVSYMGMVARTTVSRFPEWTVTVDGQTIPELSYSTESGVDESLSHLVSGLNIANGDIFTITWESDRGDGSGASRHIGIGDVNVTATEPIEWIGGTDSDWNNTANWSTEDIPEASDNVTIPETSNNPVIASDDVVTIENLTIDANATLTIESDANNTGILIVNGSYTGPGTVIAERYMENDRWYILGAPVSGQDITDFVAEGSNHIPSFEEDETVYHAVRIYDEGNNRWAGGEGVGDYISDTYLSQHNPSFTSGQGYALFRRNGSEEAGTVAFRGSLETGEVNVSVTRSVDRFGWNALATPYTAPIGVTDGAVSTDNFLDVNKDKFNEGFMSLYVWDANTNDYRIINKASNPFDLGEWDTDYIQSGQGFLVNVTNGAAPFTFTPEMRHGFEDPGDQPGIMSVEGTSSGASWSGVRIGMRVNGGSEHVTDVLFNEAMSMGLDAGYDAGAAPGQSVYTHQAQGDSDIGLGIQALPLSAMDDLSLPIGLASGSHGEVTFRLETSGLPDYVTVRLEDASDSDNETGLMVQSHSSEETKTFTVAEGDKTYGRFYLVFEVERTASGISKLWLDQHELATDGSVDNTSNNGSPFTVHQEWIAGTNPNDPSDILRLTQPPIPTPDGTGHIIRWRSVPTRTYTIQRSTNLLSTPSFQTIDSNIPGGEEFTEYTDNAATTPGPYYYRILVNPPQQQ